MSLDPRQAVEETVIDLAKKVQEVVKMGKPDEAAKYAEALRDAAAALVDASNA